MNMITMTGFSFSETACGFSRKLPDFLRDNLLLMDMAFCRWLDIFENPIQMEKIAKSRMENEQSDDKLELAISDDDEKFYEAEVRDQAQ